MIPPRWPAPSSNWAVTPAGAPSSAPEPPCARRPSPPRSPPPPFRALTRVSREERSIGAAPERYLARVAEVQRRMPHVLLIPGVEVMPHYYWTGSPLALDLTVHNLQKNLLVFGVRDPAALRSLPVPGSGPGGGYTVHSVADALPVVLLVPGLALLLRRRPVRRRLGRGAVVVVRRRAWGLGGVLCLVGLAALVRC